MLRWTVALLALCGSAAASAHWQYTKWGMTPEQVAMAAPASFTRLSDPDLDSATSRTRLGTNYEAMGFTFAAFFQFDRATGGLDRVKLLLRGEGCDELRFKLFNVYGEPDRRPVLGSVRWRDEANGNIVAFVPVGGCWVEYFPAPPRGRSGL